MKKRILSTIMALVAIMFAASAQQDDPVDNSIINRNPSITILFDNLSYPKAAEQKESLGKQIFNTVSEVILAGKVTTHESGYFGALRACVSNGLSHGRRIILTDDVTKRHGIDYIVDGTVNDISVVTDVSVNHITRYKAILSLSLNIRDGKTGNIITGTTFTESDIYDYWAANAADALNNALYSITNDISYYINRCFRLTANIVEGAKFKKDKQKEVYIDLGDNLISSGIRFNVYTLHTIAGKEARKRIGEIEVTETMGADISLCKVRSGGKEIKSAIDAGEKLLIISNN